MNTMRYPKVALVTNPGDWCELYVDGESKYRGHETDLDAETVLAAVGIECEVHRNVPIGPDNRTFDTTGVDL